MAVAVVKERSPSQEPERRGSAISISGLSKRFGDVHVLDDVNLELERGEFVSILGPSGCGKSTLLRIAAGLIPHEEGSVGVMGRPASGPTDDIGVVFQTHNLLPWRNVEQNLRLGTETLRPPPEDVESRIASMVELIGLGEFRKHYPHELSGGMRQRVALGQALIRNPQILLMDEPFGALDALTRDRLNVELLRIWQAERKTVMLVTHSIVESVFLSDRVIVLSDRPAQLLEEVTIDLPRPRSPRKTREAPKFGEYVVHLSQIMGVL